MEKSRVIELENLCAVLDRSQHLLICAKVDLNRDTLGLSSECDCGLQAARSELEVIVRLVFAATRAGESAEDPVKFWCEKHNKSMLPPKNGAAECSDCKNEERCPGCGEIDGPKCSGGYCCI